MKDILLPVSKILLSLLTVFFVEAYEIDLLLVLTASRIVVEISTLFVRIAAGQDAVREFCCFDVVSSHVVSQLC